MRSISASFRRIQRQSLYRVSTLSRRLATTNTSPTAKSAPVLSIPNSTLSKASVVAVNCTTKIDSWKPDMLACAAVAAVAVAAVVYIDCVAEEMQARDGNHSLLDDGMNHASAAHHARAEKHDLDEERIHLQKLVDWSRVLDPMKRTHLKAVAGTLLMMDSNRVSGRLDYDAGDDGTVNRGVCMKSPILDRLFVLTCHIEPETLSKLDQLFRRLNASHHFASNSAQTIPAGSSPTSVTTTTKTTPISADELRYNKYVKAFKAHCKFCGLFDHDPREEMHFHAEEPLCTTRKPVSAQEFVVNLVYDELVLNARNAHQQILAKTGLSITDLFTGFPYRHGGCVPDSRYDLQKLKLSNPIEFLKTHPYLLLACTEKPILAYPYILRPFTEKPIFANEFSGEYARVVNEKEESNSPPSSPPATPPSSTPITNVCCRESPTTLATTTASSRENVVYKGFGAYHTIA